MSLQVGIVGLPNVGKSTLFNALTNAGAAVASYPFTTIDPNIGIAAVPDSRLDRLGEIVQPERLVPATIKFVDIAGLVKGAHQGEGLGNQFLGHIRDVDIIAVVARCFTAEDVVRVSDSAEEPVGSAVDPLDELDVLDLELILADLAVLERRIDKVQGLAKAQPRAVEAELAALNDLRQHLQAGQLATTWAGVENASDYLESIALVTDKPRVYVANVDEESLPAGGALVERIAARAASENTRSVAVCAQMEADLAEWDSDEAALYRAELGVSTSGLEALIAAAFATLDLITFFTTTGGHEVRAWPLRRGSLAPQAAGRIHTDMERGFIRAEVVTFQDLDQAGSMARAREQGLVRVEGRDYVVQDGDVCHFRFNV
jgi:GTP-binding protein YchF